MKPMLASDFDEKKLRFPLVAQPKVDGVRGINLNGKLTGRSLKPHANLFTTAKFSQPHFVGLDGEFAMGEHNNPDLCRNTTSALNTIQGEPCTIWHVFDFITAATIDKPYLERYRLLEERVATLYNPCVRMMPSFVVRTLEELCALEDKWVNEGFEGVIVRDQNGVYKQGRSTVREGGLLRIKRFIEEDATVLAVIEGQSNGNEAKMNELGRTERSTHQENMTPNGLVGTLICRLDRDIVFRDKVLFERGMEFTVSAGSMNHDDRRNYFVNQGEIIGKTIKFKTFPVGVKSLPRFPTFVSIRMESDKVCG